MYMLILKLTQKVVCFQWFIVPCTLYSQAYQLSQIFCESLVISLLLTLIFCFALDSCSPLALPWTCAHPVSGLFYLTEI